MGRSTAAVSLPDPLALGAGLLAQPASKPLAFLLSVYRDGWSRGCSVPSCGGERSSPW